MIDNNSTNRKAIITLILGILSIFVPILGLILGVLGVIFSNISNKEIISRKEKGQGIRITGLVFSLIGIIIQIPMIMGFITVYMLQSTP
ncbi:DUF4190 domain-containing protein [Rummeliibacillus pycnus]|uniref:DUF4190 domain-containing protein n=1 Tax=Rummeliibacillus pycnus TaxID=101070 RepID=UPI003D2C253A